MPGGNKNMKKMISFTIISLMLLSGIGTTALSYTEKSQDYLITEECISTAAPRITSDQEYQTVEVDEATSMLLETGKPMLPVISRTYTYPIGTVIESVDIEFDTYQTTLEKKIQPSPRPVPLTDAISVDPIVEMDATVYDSDQLYPEEPCTIRTGVGTQQGQRCLFVTIDCYTQYAPLSNQLFTPSNIDIQIKFSQPTQTLALPDEYDLLIITTEEFVDELQPLVDHKNANGIKTIVDTVENIYPSYDGRDDAEDIKLRIKDALDEWGIEYVLLAGGRKGQTLKWHVPSRTTLNDDGWEEGYESDLYFADIYKDVEGELVFEDWDSDGDGKFAEFGFMGDKMDYYPDVTIGRLPFRYAFEIGPVIDKIIDYEMNCDDSWFKKGIVISGDTFPPSRGGDPGWWEGEMETQITVDLLESIGFSMEKLWLSIPGAWTSSEDVINAISDGAGFVHFAGHSNPAGWGNHPPDDEDHVFIDGIEIWDMSKLTNEGQYPVVVLGGCHSAQFNVTLSHIITGIMEYGIKGYFFGSPYRFFYYEWVPNDLSSWFVIEPEGGAIASMGNSGLGYGYVNEGAVQGLGGWIEPRFFDCFVNQSIDVLGTAHDQAIIDYINIIGNVNKDQIDRKCIEEWVLIGDPTLKMGGL